eukprot:sb/3466656/
MLLWLASLCLLVCLSGAEYCYSNKCYDTENYNYIECDQKYYYCYQGFYEAKCYSWGTTRDKIWCWEDEYCTNDIYTGQPSCESYGHSTVGGVFVAFIGGFIFFVAVIIAICKNHRRRQFRGRVITNRVPSVVGATVTTNANGTVVHPTVAYSPRGAGSVSVQYPPAHYPPVQNLPGQHTPAQYPPGQNPPAQYPPVQYPPGQNPPAQYPPGQNPQPNYPPGQNPPAQYPPGQNPQPNYPPGQNPPAQYPPGQNPQPNYPPGQNPPAQYPPGQNPPAQYPPGQNVPAQYPPTSGSGPYPPYGPPSPGTITAAPPYNSSMPLPPPPSYNDL